MDDLRWTGLSTFAEEKPPVEEEKKHGQFRNWKLNRERE